MRRMRAVVNRSREPGGLVYGGRRLSGRIAGRLAALSTGRPGVMLLGTLSLAGGLGYVALVGTNLATTPQPPEPDEVDAVGLIQNTPNAPTAVLHITVDDGVDDDSDEPDEPDDTDDPDETDDGADAEDSDEDAAGDTNGGESPQAEDDPEPLGDSEHRVICRGDADADPEACALVGELDDPFAEADDDANCTDVSYGPERATISGYWDGEQVDTVLTRDGSCAEARWQRLRPLTQPAE
ncbi:hypothetical protein RIF23_11715 [Lipingzhangella sp. LS1_29]|uniref:Subtilisin inhibitor-like n=2 Tax=Lipingzhangella rawalii TaxID=2055835 RepID=A0ABU2H806_9ACTN|nr:hypothetical protein [Lipingzhangella rawalii]